MNASPLTRKVFTTILAIILISRVAQQCAVAIRDLTGVSIKKAGGRRDCHVSIIHTDMFVNVDSPVPQGATRVRTDEERESVFPRHLGDQLRPGFRRGKCRLSKCHRAPSPRRPHHCVRRFIRGSVNLRLVTLQP